MLNVCHIGHFYDTRSSEPGFFQSRDVHLSFSRATIDVKQDFS